MTPLTTRDTAHIETHIRTLHAAYLRTTLRRLAHEITTRLSAQGGHLQGS